MRGDYLKDERLIADLEGERNNLIAEIGIVRAANAMQSDSIRRLQPAFDDLDWIENQLHSGIDITLGVGLDEDDGKVHVRLVGFDGVHLFKGDDLHLAIEAARLAVARH